MEQAAKLLDFSQKLDIGLLDNIVMCMYCGEGQQVCHHSLVNSYYRLPYILISLI